MLVFNNTRVIPARLFGRKETGGQVEVMLERLSTTANAWPSCGSVRHLAQGQIISLRTVHSWK